MKRFSTILLLTLLITQQSCIMMVKTVARNVTKGYDDYVTTNLSSDRLTDLRGRSATIGELFPGKTVYAIVYNSPLDNPPVSGDTKHDELKQRFAHYKDVAFIGVYKGDNETYWSGLREKLNGRSDIYRLGSAYSEPWEKLGNTPDALIIGKDGTVLGYKAPSAGSGTLTDYVLDAARDGKDATTASKELIREINEGGRFKSEHMRKWYKQHYNKPADDVVNIHLTSE